MVGGHTDLREAVRREFPPPSWERRTPMRPDLLSNVPYPWCAADISDGASPSAERS